MRPPPMTEHRHESRNGAHRDTLTGFLVARAGRYRAGDLYRSSRRCGSACRTTSCTPDARLRFIGLKNFSLALKGRGLLDLPLPLRGVGGRHRLRAARAGALHGAAAQPELLVARRGAGAGDHPWALPSVIIGLMWTWIYEFNTGVLNDILMRMGRPRRPVPWLASPATALGCRDAGAHLAGLSFLRHHDPRGPADRAARTLRSGRDRRRDAVPAVRARHRCRGSPGSWRRRLLLRIIWVANSLDVILVMTGGGPGLRHPYAAALRVPAGL